MRPALSGRDRRDQRLEQADRIIGQYQQTIAVFGQVIARLVESSGGSWRVVECGTCIHNPDSFARFLEIQLPGGLPILVALHGEDSISSEIVPLDHPPMATTSLAQLKAWLAGMTLQE